MLWLIAQGGREGEADKTRDSWSHCSYNQKHRVTDCSVHLSFSIRFSHPHSGKVSRHLLTHSRNPFIGMPRSLSLKSSRSRRVGILTITASQGSSWYSIKQKHYWVSPSLASLGYLLCYPSWDNDIHLYYAYSHLASFPNQTSPSKLLYLSS